MCKNEVILAMSGGVDSSVALYLLLENGYKVRGVTMQNGSLSEGEIKAAKKTADHFKVDWELVDIKADFQDKVINPFIEAYAKGLTPNPCAICNRHIKFGSLFNMMQNRYPDSLYATGHYARIKTVHGISFLTEARDIKKDQSYFLSSVKPKILQRLIFPIGDLFKDDVREIARQKGFPSAEKSESQEICFIPNDDYATFLIKRGLTQETGDIKNETGEILGKHKGYFNYTIGQRRGLGVFGSERLFVREILPELNTLIVSTRENMNDMGLIACSLNKFTNQQQYDELSKKVIKCKVKSGSVKHDSVFRLRDDTLYVLFKEPVFALTPGQLCVLYNDEGMIVISGIINKVINKEDWYKDIHE